MDLFQITAVLEEFKFLCQGEWSDENDRPLLFDHESIEDIKINRISYELLRYTPRYRGVAGKVADIRDDERIFLVDENGKVLREVKQQRDIIHREAERDDEHQDGETVGEAMEKCYWDESVKGSVQFAVKIHKGYTIQDNRSVGGYSVVIYKPPKGFNFKDWADHQMWLAQKGVEAQIADIDAEGDAMTHRILLKILEKLYTLNAEERKSPGGQLIPIPLMKAREMVCDTLWILTTGIIPKGFHQEVINELKRIRQLPCNRIMFGQFEGTERKFDETIRDLTETADAMAMEHD